MEVKEIALSKATNGLAEHKQNLTAASIVATEYESQYAMMMRA